MNITIALKSEEKNVRVVCGDRWLFWDNETKEFVVLERKAYAKTSKIIAKTTDEDTAVFALLDE